MDIKFREVDEMVDEGINDSGIETFSYAKKSSLAREVAQNSNDAGIDDMRPVEVDFNVHTIETTEFPGIDSFRKALSDCIKDNRKIERNDAVEALEEAKKILDKQEITLLIISDRNTTGVTGQPFKKRTPFFTLLMSKGVSVKPAFSGGSFGIGKNAALASTPLRTVFYSTQFKSEQGNSEYMAMGKTILTSFTDSKSVHRSSDGFWGINGKPVTDMTILPSWLHKKEQGLTVVIPGFQVEEDWVWDFTLILLKNFFSAVVENRINFNLDKNLIKINSGTIKSYFYRDEIIDQAKLSHEYTELREKQKFLEVLTHSETDTHEIDIPNLGKFTMKTLLAEEGQKKVLFTRNGMSITSQLGPFQLKNFPGTQSFYAIVCPSEIHGEASENLRKLETSQHNHFSLDTIKSSEQRLILKKGIEKLEKEIRKRIKKIAGIKILSTNQLDELDKFFIGPEPRGDIGNAQSRPGIDLGLPVVTVRKSPIRNISQPSGNTGGSGIRSRGVRSSNKPKRLHGSKAGSAGSIRIPVLRSFVPNADFKKRIIVLSPPETGTVSIIAEGIGFDGNKEPLIVENSDHGKVDSGIVRIPVTKEIKTTLKITLATEFKGPIELICHLFQSTTVKY